MRISEIVNAAESVNDFVYVNPVENEFYFVWDYKIRDNKLILISMEMKDLPLSERVTVQELQDACRGEDLEVVPEVDENGTTAEWVKVVAGCLTEEEKGVVLLQEKEL